MKIKLCAMMTALVAATFSSAIVHAKSDAKAQMQQLHQTCKSDIDKLCSDVSPGQGRVASCLDSKRDQLSPSCKTAWSDAKAKISRKIDKADVAFRKSCGSDVQKYCSEVPSGHGRLMSCLDQHRDQLSDSCKTFEARLEEKLSKMVG